MEHTRASKTKQATLSYLAGFMFFLAGAINSFVGLHAHRNESYEVGSMFIAVGVLWMAVGTRVRTRSRILDSNGISSGDE